MGEMKTINEVISQVKTFIDSAISADTEPEQIKIIDISELDPEVIEQLLQIIGKISDLVVKKESKNDETSRVESGNTSKDTSTAGTSQAGNSGNSDNAVEGDPFSEDNSNSCGDPVNVVTGSFMTYAVDVSFNDIMEPFELRRSYESIYTNKNQMLGSKWLFNIESSVTLKEEEAIVMMPDLHLEKFIFQNSNWTNLRGGEQSLILNSNADGYVLKSLKEKKTYTYNTDGRLLLITDRNNNNIEFIYKGADLIQIVLPSRQFLKFEYSHNKLSSITDTAGRKLSYEYNGEFLTKVKCFHGGAYEYEYDEHGFISSIKNPSGVKYLENQYDRKGRVLRQEMPNGQVYTFEYNDADRETVFFTEGDGSKISYFYNKNKLLTKTLYSDGTFSEKDYDNWDNIIYERDRCGAVIHKTFNERCLLVEKIFPNGLVTGYEYDENDNLVHLSDNAGTDIFYVYDLKGNCIEERERLDNARTIAVKRQFDGRGRLIKRIDGNGNETVYDYQHNFNKPTSIKTPQGEYFYYTYDELGRTMSITGELGTVSFAYNLYSHRTMSVDGLGHTTKYFYNRCSKLVKQVNPNQYNENTGDGKGITYNYDKINRRISSIDALGAVNAVKRNTEGKVIKEIAPNAYQKDIDDGEGIVYEYDQSGNRIKIIYPDGGIERLKYNANGNIIKRIQPENYDLLTDDGAGYLYEYDSSGRLLQITNPEGIVEKKYVYDLKGNIIKIIDAKGYISGKNDEQRIGSLYQYNLAGWLLEKREPAYEENKTVYYGVTTYQYDNAGNQIQEKRYLEYQGETGLKGQVHVLNFDYDKRNRRIKVSDSTGGVMEYRYNSHNQVIHEKFKINEDVNHVKNYTYDASSRISSIMESTDKNSTGKSFAITRFQYDKTGNIIRILTPKGNEIRREYDDADQMVSELHVEKNGTIENYAKFDYDNAGNLISITDNSGNSEYRKFDLMNRMICQTDKEGGITYQEYDKNGRIQKLIHPNEYEKNGKDAHGYQFRYDTLGQLTSSIMPDGNLNEKNIYNVSGELIEQIDAYGAGAKLDYDIGGRQIQVTTTGGSTQVFQYDASGNIVGVMDGNKNQTAFRLDEWGRIIGVHKADGSMESYEYDYAGHVTRSVDGEGNRVRYCYNTSNLLSETIYQTGDKEVYQYDEEGYLKERLDRNGNIHQFEYNMYGNLLYRKDKSSGQIESYDYDSDGTLKAAISEGMRYDYSYYKSGRLKEKSASGRVLLSYEYDKNGNKIKQSDITGKLTEYYYNSLDLLTEIYDNGKKQAQYAYLPNGKLKSMRIGEEILTSYEYDLDLNLTQLKTIRGDELLASYQYEYDGNGNRIRKEQQQAATVYTYDMVNRLVKAEYPAYTEELYYDRVGNRKRRVSNGIEELYDYDVRNRLTEHTVKKDAEQEVYRYWYDNQGNLLHDNKAEYTYDNFHRLIKTTTFDNQIQINRYDAEGLRYEAEENGNLIKYLYSATEVVLEETNEDRRRYIRGYLLVSSDSEKAKTYYHYSSDEMNSITHVLDEHGKLLNRYEYDAFGNHLVCEETVENRFRYAGQQYDTLTGQYYLRGRFYNPVIGRFIQEDPNHNDGLNLYAYCKNNPVGYYDPSGYNDDDVHEGGGEELGEPKGESSLGPDGKFIDASLEEKYNTYVLRKQREGKPPRERLDWKEARDYWLYDSPMARGNAFNKTARDEGWYDYHEVHLVTGKRLDSYDPIKKEIISRKATDLDMIEEETYRKYLNELVTKYARGEKIRSNAYPELDGKKLEGKYILEVPDTNLELHDIDNYKSIAKEYGVELRFRGE